jgi:hypothetical protein
MIEFCLVLFSKWYLFFRMSSFRWFGSDYISFKSTKTRLPWNFSHAENQKSEPDEQRWRSTRITILWFFDQWSKQPYVNFYILFLNAILVLKMVTLAQKYFYENKYYSKINKKGFSIFIYSYFQGFLKYLNLIFFYLLILLTIFE